MSDHPSSRSSFFTSAPDLWLRALLVVAVLIAYANSLGGAFVFDDVSSITTNASLKLPWSFTHAFSPPGDSTVGGRPLANLTFALNHWLGGDAVLGYHLVNLAIHLLTALALFEFIRLAPFRPASSPEKSDPAPASIVSLAAALLWAVHPVLTSAVTYVSQRTECLMGLCYLLTLLGFVRGVRASSTRWLTFSVLVCAAGMAVKEVMATAPVMVLLYDRTFFAGSWREAFRLRKKYYLTLAATWGVLAWCLTSGLAQRSVGYGLGVPWTTYALAECTALVTYLRLAVWPHPLVFDYGALYPGGWTEVLWPGLGVLLLLGVTGVLLVRRPRLGFVAAWFFLALAPTSSVVPVATQPIAENRLYLPLMAVATLGALALARLPARVALGTTIALAVPLTAATVARNATYRTEAALWADTVEKRPQNPRAHNNHAQYLVLSGRFAEAAEHVEAALRISPDYAQARFNYGGLLLKLNRPADALVQVEQFLAARPRSTDGHLARANALFALRRHAEAAAVYAELVRQLPAHLVARCNYAAALAELRQWPAVIEQCTEALRQKPDLPQEAYLCASAHAELGLLSDAVANYERALRLNPGFAEAEHGLGVVCFRLGRPADALAHLEAAVRLKPDYEEARQNLARLRAHLGAP